MINLKRVDGIYRKRQNVQSPSKNVQANGKRVQAELKNVQDPMEKVQTSQKTLKPSTLDHPQQKCQKVIAGISSKEANI
jgi:hypothetical protein